MKIKPIIPCPRKFLDAGLESMIAGAVLVQIGRCGLQGCRLDMISENVKKRGKSLSLSTCDFVTRKLQEEGWITRFTRTNARGRAYWWVVTSKGWALLTQAPDVDLYPDALKQAV